MKNKKLIKEDVESIKFMMNYDTRKTLTENKQLLNEAFPLLVPLLWIGGTAAVTGLISYISKAVDENPNAAQSLRDFVTLGEKAYQAGGKISSGFDPGSEAIALYKAMFENDWINIGWSATENEDEIIRIITSLTSVVDLAALNQKYKNAYRGRDMVKDIEKSLQADEWAPISLWIERVQDALTVVKDEEEKKQEEKKQEEKKEDGNDGGNPKPKPVRIKVPIPTELNDANGVMKFQDWLDSNHAGWATGYTDGKVSRGKGYGSFGPRTQKAWNSYKTEYLNQGLSTKDPDLELDNEVDTDNGL
jgi:hypothetical protein